MPKNRIRTHYVVESKLQFWFTILIILIVSVEGIFVGWGIHYLSAIAKEWQRPEMVFDFFKTLAIMLFFLIGGNFILGMYFSHKVAGPLFRLRRALKELRKGRFSHVQLRQSDMLKDFVREFNETILVLDKLMHRDQKIVHMSWDKVDKCLSLLNGKKLPENTEEVKRILQELKSYLTTINSHFLSSGSTLKREDVNEEEKSTAD